MDFTAIKITIVIQNAGIPIHGVSIGRKNDKSTWRIDFKDEATIEQKIEASKLLQDFDESKISDPITSFEQTEEFWK
jgi:hypothetical protein